MLRRVSLAAALMTLPAVAFAAPWSGEFGLGYLATSGNTDTSSVNAKLGLEYVEGAWKNSFLATAMGATDVDDTTNEERSTAERYLAANKLDYNFTERDYAFFALEWEKDLFGAVRQRTSQTVGYGRHVLVGPEHLLDLEVGVGARQNRLNDAIRTKEDDAIARFAGKYIWNLSETSAFQQTLKVETGDTNTYTESVTELKMSIVGNLFAALAYTIRNNSDVPAGTKKTDTLTAVNLSYAFGKS
jgi:putative salt-induced outer membrane protein